MSQPSKRAFHLLTLALAIAGCNGKGFAGDGAGPVGGLDAGTGGTVAADPTRYTVVFDSFRSNDGSDAANPNLTSNLWRVNTDGTDLVPITTATARYADSFNGRWSPDGTRLVFQSKRSLDASDSALPNLTLNIWRVNADGSGLIPLTRTSSVSAEHAYNPRWSPDGTKIVFQSTRKLTQPTQQGGVGNIWRVNADGSDLIPLTKATGLQADSENPQWSPDGTKIVFQSRRQVDGSDVRADNLNINIWWVNSDGSELTPVTRATVEGTHSYNPQWSPDGTKILFQSSRNLDGSDAALPTLTVNIWRVNLNGTELIPLTNLTAKGADSGEPQWSPDGTRVAFHSKRKLDGTDGMGTTSNLWRVNADSSGLIRLTTTTQIGADCFSPQWSPDAARILFRSRRKLDGTDAFGVAFNIWSVNPDGLGLTPVTKTTVPGTDSYNPQLRR
jgi:TolB protein